MGKRVSRLPDPSETAAALANPHPSPQYHSNPAAPVQYHCTRNVNKAVRQKENLQLPTYIPTYLPTYLSAATEKDKQTKHYGGWKAGDIQVAEKRFLYKMSPIQCINSTW